MFDVVLYQPEIPPNAGNVIRLCANAGARLHLVEPLGFSMDDKQLKRAGLDYHELVNITVHRDWTACAGALAGRRMFALTSRGSVNSLRSVEAGDVFVFGAGPRGCRKKCSRSSPPTQLRLPMRPDNPHQPSNAVAVLVFEAWRQQGLRARPEGEVLRRGPRDAQHR
jgi:tRNA (cytidine/uridine-2'-O-)-methyltransferase